MKQIILISIAVLFFACDSDKKKSAEGPGSGEARPGPGPTPGPEEVVVMETPKVIGPDGKPVVPDEAKTGDSDESALMIIGPSGSSLRFLDARGLSKFYRHVFVPDTFGFVHCKGGKPREIKDCTDSIFTQDERDSMGSFDLYNQRFRRGPINVNPAENLTLNYTRTLRAALSRECNNLVDREIAALNASKMENNILIKAELPTEAVINDFMKRLLGVAGTPITVDVSAAEYVTAFSSVLGDKKDKERSDAMKRSYQSLCIALAMDPQVFLY